MDETQVFFVAVTPEDRVDDVARKSVELLKRSGLQEVFSKDHLVAVKQHFGEHPDGRFVKPPVAAALVKLLKERGARPFLTDTTTLYRGGRSDAVGYLERIREHGFTYEAVGAPAVIADGLRGTEGVEVEIDGKLFSRVKLAAAAYYADSVLVLTHVTGHCQAGLGGAIKNVGMGLATRAGKLLQHYGAAPRVEKEKCVGCGECVRWCPAEAISLVERGGKRRARIDRKRCIGCGECLAACRVGAMSFDWSKEGRGLARRMVEHALGFVRNKAGRVVYLSYLTDMTRNCDCCRTEKPVVDAIGILAATDLVACDQATVDVVNRHTGKDFFAELWPDYDYREQLAYGEELGLGTRRYRLVEL